MQGNSSNTSPTQSDAFLAALRDKVIVAHVLGVSGGLSAGMGAPMASTISGRLAVIYPDAVVIEIARDDQPTGERILIYKRAIVAIETR